MKNQLNTDLEQIQFNSRVDLAILVLPEPRSEPLSALAPRVFTAWGIGKKWEGGGALLVVSSDGSNAILYQADSDRPFPDKTREILQSRVTAQARITDLSSALAAFIEQARRQLAAHTQESPALHESLEPDYAVVRSYGTMLLVVFGVAAISRHLRWSDR